MVTQVTPPRAKRKDHTVNAIIVAAGTGKRLHDFTRDRPKCMIEINGRTLLERQTEVLIQNGISEINVVIGYRKEWFKDKRFRYFLNTDYEK